MGAGDCHGGLPRRLEGTKKHEGFCRGEKSKGGYAEMIFFVGRFRHEGSKARRNTKVFAGEKGVKEVTRR